MKKCIYCKVQLSDDNVIDFCDHCGKGAFGEKMFHVIVKNMTEAGRRGDLFQGKV